MLSNKVYDFLKWFAIVGLKALGEAYQDIAGILSWPYGAEVNLLTSRIGILLGLFLAWETYKFSQSNTIIVTPNGVSEEE